MGKWFLILTALLLLLFSACSGGEESTPATTDAKPDLAANKPTAAKTETALTETGEPERVKVQHVLIGFEGTLPGKDVTRSAPDAKELAHQIFEWAQGGQNFGDLEERYSDDDHPGIYIMTNTGIEAPEEAYARADMVKGFGDVAFSLKVGEIGMTDYNEENRISPYGWHIIKRLE